MVSVINGGRPARVQLAAMRLAATTGRIRRATKLIAKVMPAGGQVDVTVGGGGVLTVDLDDAYWCRIVVGLPYEPEIGAAIDWALRQFDEVPLIDCGANIGYWSTTYASRTSVTAIEALPHIHAALQRAAERNGFTAVHGAIWSRDGEQVTMRWNTGGETGASAVDEDPRSEHAQVPTVSIDGLAPPGPFIVKLDVEGAEAAALDGAGRSRERALWIYEDHGGSSEHESTETFLRLGFRFGAIDEQTGRIAPLALADLDRLKVQAHKGYNFAAWAPNGPWAPLIASS